MKRIIYIIAAFASICAVSCSKPKDNSAFDELLAKDFNQVVKWDVDSLAFGRTEWETKTFEGAVVKTANVSVWNEQHKVTFLEYNTNAFATLLAYSDQQKTLPELMAGREALFAISGAPCSAEGPLTFTMYDENVIRYSNDPSLEGINGIVTVKKSDSYVTAAGIFEELNYSSIYNSGEYLHAMAAGPVLVSKGEIQDVPDSDSKTLTVLGITAGGSNRFITFESVTLKQAALLANYMNLRTAVVLGEGDSSGIWTNESGIVAGSGTGMNCTALYVMANKLFDGGEGTESSPYRISNVGQLLNMSSVLADGKITCFELVNDIDMEGVEWTPLNIVEPYTKGVSFDGRGHTISHFTMKHSVSSYPSFFGVLYGTCRNVRFVDVEFNSPNYANTGVVAGYAGANNEIVTAVIENVYVEGKLTMGGNNNIGGIAGVTNKVTMTNCYANVTITKASASNGAGGLVGLSNVNTKIRNCYVRGRIDASCERVGGITGTNNAEECYIEGCITWMDEIHGGNRVGAIAGYAGAHETHGHKIGNCFYWTSLKMYDTKGLIESPGDKDTNPNDGKPRYNGQSTGNIISTAQSIGWDTTVWDLSGTFPEIKWTSFN